MTLSVEEILNSHKTGRSVIMGILNVTPDSFSDGGEYLACEDALTQARKMIHNGADVIDIGAESTRPGSHPVSPDDQISRLDGIIPSIKEAGTIISIDTTSEKVARFALSQGADIINDVSAGRDDPAMLPLAAESGAPIILMHMLGKPRDMQKSPQYDDVVRQVCEFLSQRAQACITAGIRPGKIILDPGIGFGKLRAHNLALLAGCGTLVDMGMPVLIGVSRKRFIGEITGKSAACDRTAGTLAACLAARQNGATIFRVHDIAEICDALKVFESIASCPGQSTAPRPAK